MVFVKSSHFVTEVNHRFTTLIISVRFLRAAISASLIDAYILSANGEPPGAPAQLKIQRIPIF